MGAKIHERSKWQVLYRRRQHSLYSFYSDTDYEYEQLKAKLADFNNTDAEVEDFEPEDYLVLFF